jgi:hypothetical protein
MDRELGMITNIINRTDISFAMIRFIDQQPFRYAGLAIGSR